MAQRLGIYGTTFGPYFDLYRGEQHNWIAWGPFAENGVVSWVAVKPFPDGHDFPGEKFLEVTDFRYEAADDGSRRIFYSVRNTGPSDVLAYAVYWAWTDVITQ